MSAEIGIDVQNVSKNFGNWGIFMRTGAVLVRKAFWQYQINQQSICCSESGRKEKWRAVGDAAHDSTDHRAESKTKAERGADQAHRAGALFGSRNVGNIGLRNGNVSASNASKNSGDEKERQSGRHSHEGEAGRRACDAHHQDGTATEPVGKFPENRREDNLHAGINSGEPANGHGRSVEMLRVEWKHGNDNTESNQVDEDCEEENKKRRAGACHSKR